MFRIFSSSASSFLFRHDTLLIKKASSGKRLENVEVKKIFFVRR